MSGAANTFYFRPFPISTIQHFPDFLHPIDVLAYSGKSKSSFEDAGAKENRDSTNGDERLPTTIPHREEVAGEAAFSPLAVQPQTELIGEEAKHASSSYSGTPKVRGRGSAADDATSLVEPSQLFQSQVHPYPSSLLEYVGVRLTKKSKEKEKG